MFWLLRPAETGLGACVRACRVGGVNSVACRSLKSCQASSGRPFLSHPLTKTPQDEPAALVSMLATAAATSTALRTNDPAANTQLA